MIKVTGLVNHK